MNIPSCFCVLLMIMACPAEARPFKDMCERFAPINKLAGLKYVKPAIKVSGKDGKATATPIAFTIHAKSGDIKVMPNADGAIAFPMTPQLCEENPDIQSNQPPDAISMSISVDVNAAPTQSLDYKVFADMKADWDEAIGRQNLMYRMLAPGAKAGVIRFEPGKAATAEVKLPSGVKKLTADAKGEIRIPFDDAWKAANPAITLSDMPKRIGLAFKD